jgi:Protein of unknown function (DUF3043)
VPSLFRRKSAELVSEPIDEVEPEPEQARAKGSPMGRAYTPKKGEATPKRPVANRRAAAPPPANTKEARKLAREKRTQDAADRRRGMAEGDDRYLTPRDRGPVRRYVRDIVDARRNIGSLFFFGTITVLALSMVPIFAVQFGSNMLFLAMILAILADSVLLTRRVRRLVTEKFPKNTERWGSLYLYAVMRALAFRRMRIPKPQVRPGDAV